MGLGFALQEQHVFAFLPVRPYGLKFIIHCDFVLAVGREDILRQNPWNMTLRDAVAPVFLDAVEEFKTDEKLKYTFYDCIPSEKDVSDEFFLSIVNQIYEGLQNADFLLSESNQWRKPSEILLADSEMRKLIPNEVVCNHFSKEYLCDQSKVPEFVLSRLNVEKFSFDLLVKCLEAEDWTKKQNDEWFASLYYFLAKEGLDESQIGVLKKLRILKLENGDLTSAEDGPVFLPFSNRKGKYGFETELRFIKKDAFDLTRKHSPKRSSQLNSFFSKLGVKRPQPYEIIEDYILPIYESEEWKNTKDEVRIGHMKYLKDNIATYAGEKLKELVTSNPGVTVEKPDPLGRVKGSIYLRIQKEGSLYHSHPNEIYLSKVYGSKSRCEQIFEGLDGVYFLHTCYADSIPSLRRRSTDANNPANKKETDRIRRINLQEIKKWRDFFLKLGVNKFLKMEKDPQTAIYQGSNYANSEVTRVHFWSGNKDQTAWKDCELRESDKGYYINDDWDSTHLRTFFSRLGDLSQDAKDKSCRKLLCLLDKNWEFFKNYRHCRYYYRVYNQYGGWSRSETFSTFMLTLRNTPWIPTKENKLEKPICVFTDRSETREIFGDTVEYLNVKLENTEFVRDMGICQSVSVDKVLTFLEANIERLAKDQHQLEKIYKFLSNNFAGHEDKIRSCFESKSLILVPHANKVVSSQNVFWLDVSDVFGEQRYYLKKYYGPLRDFFVNKLHISERPTFRDYADLLVSFSKNGPFDNSQIAIVLKIYEELNDGLKAEIENNSIAEEDWWPEFAKEPILLTDKTVFVENSNEQVLIADSVKLYDVFKNEPKISFLALPENYNPYKIALFAKAFDVRFLSHSVKKNPIVDETALVKHDKLTKKLRALSDYIIRYIYWKEYEKYRLLKQYGLFDLLRNFEVCRVNSLMVDFSIELKDDYVVSVRASDTSVLFKNRFLISTEIEETEDRVAVEFTRVFGMVKGLDSFAVFVSEKESGPKVEYLLKLLNIGEIPDSEKISSQKTPPEEEPEQKPVIESPPEEPKEPVPEPPPIVPSKDETPTTEPPETPKDTTPETTQTPETSPGQIPVVEPPTLEPLPQEELVTEPPPVVSSTHEPPTPESKPETVKDTPSETSPASETPPEQEPEEPVNESPPAVEPPPGESPQRPPKTTTEINLRDSTKANWVKRSYCYNCQICLSKEAPLTLAHPKSYASVLSNRRIMIEAHHVKEIVKGEGHDDVGNIISLCRHHHNWFNQNLFKIPLLNIIQESLNNITEKDIIWPDGQKTTWKLMNCKLISPDGQPLQIIFTASHLGQIERYLQFIVNKK
jgi:hypothetical protein